MEEEVDNNQKEKEESTGYSKYGIVDIPKTSIATSWGQTKTFAGLSRTELTFLLVTTVNILTAIGLTLYSFITVIKNDPEVPDFTFALLLLINAVFCLFYAFHGTLRERIYELYVLIIAIVVIVLYCTVEYGVNEKGRKTFKLVRMILTCVLAPPNIVLAWRVASDFGYLQFRIVGASEFLQHLYAQASIFSCALKFDVQVTVSMVVLVLRKGTSLNVLEQVVLGVGIPYSILWNILGSLVLKKEWRSGAFIFAFLGLAKPAYYIYKVIQYVNIDDNIRESQFITYAVLVAGILALLVWLILMIELYIVCKNFGNGLKEIAFETSTESTSLITGRKQRHRNPAI
ncbi:uncharacterized protein LOC132553882 isoform X2 [Ylistrum balloti]|uniref:uncharacterized protein LOC132553882 isoform X2 n=1 Tax=Ylistrum balloti TaxID=509963 RepID=UPI002905E8F5|nr:uncharacterized protein LOC132553882 isoform X2 [Ylistrum balloti]